MKPTGAPLFLFACLADREGDYVGVHHTEVPRTLMVCGAMGHRQVGPRLRAALDAKPAPLANEIGDTDALALDIFPELRVHRAAFELDDLVSHPLQILRHVSAAYGAEGNLPKEAGIRLEGERWHGCESNPRY